MEWITEAVIRAVKSLYDADVKPGEISLQETRKEFEGQVTLVTFPLTRLSRKSPEVTAREIGEVIKSDVDAIGGYNVIKGFLNISLSDTFWLDKFYQEILRDDFAEFPADQGRVMVEYSSPNTNKPLHLGHVRNNLLGYSVAAILQAAGYEVIKANLVNDRGIHICKSMLAWQLYGNGETPDTSGMKGDHLVGKYYVYFDREYKKQVQALTGAGLAEEQAKKEAPLIRDAQDMLRKWEAGDPAVVSLWRTMNGWVYEGFNATYERLGVNFDQFYFESQTYLLGKDIVDEGLSKGVFYTKPDGSVWVDLTSEGLDEKLLLRADGTSVYMTQDLGTAQLKYDQYRMDGSIYVVGNEQDYHFKVLFLILEKLGRSWAKGLFHLSYGMVDLPTGKMKSREGTVVDADDLINEMEQTAKEHTEALGKIEGFSEAEKQVLFHMIGMGALKYFLLKVDPRKRMLFDPNESVDFQGHTGPFIQYTHARICSVLNRAPGAGSERTAIAVLSAEERELIFVLSQLPAMIRDAAKGHNPALIANYVYELAKAYNKFYHEHSILQAEDEVTKVFRLQLSAASAKVLRKGMKLLGIDVPERM